MVLSRKLVLLGSATAVLALVSTAVFAQQQGAPRAAQRQPGAIGGQPVTQQPGAVQQQRVTANKLVAESSPSTDQIIANCVAIANQEEIALAKFAESKSENRKVRELAAQLVKEHTRFLQELGRHGAMVTALNVRNERGEAGQRTVRANQNGQQGAQEQGRNQQVVTSQQEGGRPAFNHLTVARQIAEQCLGRAEKELGEMQGEHFDKAFVGMQIGAHEHMLAELEVLRQYASGNLQQLIGQGIQTTEMHLDHVKQLMRALEKPDSDRSDNTVKPEK